MTKGIFFDLYGTLFEYGDMDKAWNRWFQTLYRSLLPFGLTETEDEISDRCSDFLSLEEPDDPDPELTVLGKRLKRLCGSLNITIDNESISHIAELIVSGWQDECRLDEDAVTVLVELAQRKRLCLISDFDHPPHVYRLLREHGIDRFFEVITVSGDVGCRKPDPAIFRHALDHTGLDPSEVCYVGDSEVDILGAQNAGFTPVLICRPGNRTGRQALDYSSKALSKELYLQEKYPDVRVVNGLTDLLLL